jgi:hypothetical protein
MEAAVRNGNVKIFAKLLAIYEYDLPDMTKETLPLYAIEIGQIAILEYIVKNNHKIGFYLTADPKHCNRQDPLVHAVSRDNLDAVRLLVQIPSRRESSDISHAVKIALYGIPNVEIVKELISLPNFNAMQDDGKLLILCVKKGLPECLQLLLSTMLSVNDRTHSKLCKMADDLGNDAITEMLNKRPVRNASSWWNLFIFATVLLPLLLICVVAIENRMTYRDVHYPSCIDKPNLEHANVWMNHIDEKFGSVSSCDTGSWRYELGEFALNQIHDTGDGVSCTDPRGSPEEELMIHKYAAFNWMPYSYTFVKNILICARGYHKRGEGHDKIIDGLISLPKRICSEIEA